MRVCKYCGTVLEDTDEVCTSCGAREFNHKCNNCGTVYEKGTRCPSCGVKANAKAKTCPTCGAKYYTKDCPNCGPEEPVYKEYERPQQQARPSTVAPQKPVQKRNTLLWVLGWIFVFPIPLYTLAWRTENWIIRIISILLAPVVIYIYIFYIIFWVGVAAITFDL